MPCPPPHSDASAHRDARSSAFFIIDAHLQKARQSSAAALRLHSQGLHAQAITQNRLTQVFLHNALARLNPQCEDPNHRTF